jgi:alpha-D-ribose 1-methylphosphonate 5-triphosphate synthase subunit PhnG
MENPANTGLVMIKARDSVSLQPFYLGENLVTECSVSIQGHFGMGVIMGDEPERAYQIAVVDAAYNANLQVTESWLKELEEQEKEIYTRHLHERALVNTSQVHFDTMEDYNDKS